MKRETGEKYWNNANRRTRVANPLAVDATVSIQGVQLLGNTLRVTLELDGSIGSAISVDLLANVFSDITGSQLSQSATANFNGNNGQLVTVDINLTGINATADLFVALSLGNLSIALNLDLNIDLADLQLFSLVNGILAPITNILDPILGLSQAAAAVVFGNVTVTLNTLYVNVQLTAAVSGGVAVDVNLNLLASLGVPVLSTSLVATVQFAGVAGEIETAVFSIPILSTLTAALSLSVNANVSLDVSATLDVQLSDILSAK